MDTQFLIQLGVIFGMIGTGLAAFFRWNTTRFKINVDNDSVKRKEVSELLEKLYNDTQSELKLLRKEHALEIEQLKKEHRESLDKRDKEMEAKAQMYSEEIKKRDIIIGEIIMRIPRESREIIQNKMKELNLEIKS